MCYPEFPRIKNRVGFRIMLPITLRVEGMFPNRERRRVSFVRTIRVAERFEEAISVAGWSGRRRQFAPRSSLPARPGGYGEKPPTLPHCRLGAQAGSHRIAARYHDQPLTSFSSSLHSQPPPHYRCVR